MNSFVGAFHDAVVLYALALNETLSSGLDPKNGTDITGRMWNRTFEGQLVCGGRELHAHGLVAEGGSYRID